MKFTNKYCIIITTSNQERIIHTIATCLINENLSNCVQVEQIKSVYKWQGKIEIADEYRLQIKASQINYAAIEAIIRNNHNYELPEIILVDISGGYNKYLEWLEPDDINKPSR